MGMLIVAAHPDDEVLGAGGSIARWAREGREVATVILGEGSTSRGASSDDADLRRAVDDRREASNAAARALGVPPPVHLDLPDNRFDRLDLLDVVKLVEEQIARVGPSTVVSHHPGDLNIDHRITAQAVITACRPQPDHPVATVLSFEIPSSTEWSFGLAAPPFQPAVFVDITATFDDKLAGLEAYADEMRPFPHARSVEAVIAQATRWGATVGVPRAEAFQLVRAIR